MRVWYFNAVSHPFLLSSFYLPVSMKRSGGEGDIFPLYLSFTHLFFLLPLLRFSISLSPVMFREALRWPCVISKLKTSWYLDKFLCMRVPLSTHTLFCHIVCVCVCCLAFVVAFKLCPRQHLHCSIILYRSSFPHTKHAEHNFYPMLSLLCTSPYRSTASPPPFLKKLMSLHPHPLLPVHEEEETATLKIWMKMKTKY